jgi:hypothetical protein
MKRFAACALIAALTACADSSRTIPPQDEIPDAGTGRGDAAADGMLVVHMQPDWESGRYGLDTSRPPESFYNVLTAEGDVVRSDVRDVVSLAPGRYLVEVPHATEHARWFWVTVKAREVTEVDARKIPADAR